MRSLLLLLLSHFSRVRLCATPETEAHQDPPSLGFSRQLGAEMRGRAGQGSQSSRLAPFSRKQGPRGSQKPTCLGMSVGGGGQSVQLWFNPGIFSSFLNSLLSNDSWGMDIGMSFSLLNWLWPLCILCLSASVE